MAVKYQDYYQTLGVSRTASQDEIQRAYRKLARQFHPDVNKEAGAEARFKLINEAYEVLKDPERRKRYDQLGADWKSGQDFSPPPGWENFGVNFGQQGRAGRSRSGRAGRSARGAGPDVGGFDGFGGFSDFFEAIFGGGGGGGGASPFGAQGFTGRSPAGPQPGATHEADLTVSLEDAFRGATRRITLEASQPDGRGGANRSSKSYDVRIPPGTIDGSVIRLAGQGAAGQGGGAPGDLLLRIHIAPDPRFTVSGHDITAPLPISPWEAALGAKVPAPTLDGEVVITIPPGSQSGQRLRLRGKGLPTRAGDRGDEYVELRIVVPKELSPSERAAFENLRDVSNFNPRRA